MKKHRFNYLPDANQIDFAGIKDSIAKYGFDNNQPITLFEGDVLDGWQRQRACDELGIMPTYRDFNGTNSEALDFVHKVNERRNLNSGQKAICAAEAEELAREIAAEAEKSRRQAISHARTLPETSQKFDASQTNDKRTDHKLAEAFGTNRTYVNQARKIKEAAPEIAEKVKAGKMTHQDAMRAVRAIPTNPWLDDEEQRKASVLSGITVVANSERDKNLIAWAEKNGKAVRVDRGSIYGNPFVMDQDGDRDAVCDAYRDHYLPHKPSILKRLPELHGKVLVCHCYPQRCHAESLIK